MNIMELGALGEFLGSIGVIATLIYLAVQIRQNTASMSDSRKLAIAQTYHQRAATNYNAMVALGNGPLGPIISKAFAEGIGTLTPEEGSRFSRYCFGIKNWFDNIHFQYGQGYFEPEYYESTFKSGVRLWAPLWNEMLELGEAWRPEFEAEIGRILAQEEHESP